MTDEHQSAEVFPHVWHVNRCQYVEVEEDVDGIADGDEYDHCKYLLGRLFDNDSDAYNVYNCYALRNGFGIRKDGLQRFKISKDIIRRYYMYNNEGFKRQDPRQESRYAGKHNKPRCRCRVRIEIAVTLTSQWIMSKFLEEHNHDFATPKGGAWGGGQGHPTFIFFLYFQNFFQK